MIQPIQDRVIVRRDTPKKLSDGGLIIPDTAQKTADSGVVISIGPGKRSARDGTRMPVSVDVGDRVTFAKFAGNKIDPVNPEDADGEYLVLQEDEILTRDPF